MDARPIRENFLCPQGVLRPGVKINSEQSAAGKQMKKCREKKVLQREGQGWGGASTGERGYLSRPGVWGLEWAPPLPALESPEADVASLIVHTAGRDGKSDLSSLSWLLTTSHNPPHSPPPSEGGYTNWITALPQQLPNLSTTFVPPSPCQNCFVP